MFWILISRSDDAGPTTAEDFIRILLLLFIHTLFTKYFHIQSSPLFILVCFQNIMNLNFDFLYLNSKLLIARYYHISALIFVKIDYLLQLIDMFILIIMQFMNAQIYMNISII
ncbi:hypothetical protein ACJX0J_041146 [Zea mays]